MTNQQWPDRLHPPDPVRVAFLLREFWRQLEQLPDLLLRQEHLLVDRCTSSLRTLVIEMMLALNGVAWPDSTAHLNSYLSPSQRHALHKTLILSEVANAHWIGRAVAIVVIYRWYAPQLVEKFGVAYPQADEDAALAQLQQMLPDWPLSITTS
jgi:hypothetical protein